MLLLAQTAPDPSALANFLQVAAYLVGIVTGVVILLNQFRGQKRELINSPLEVKAHAGNVSREELRQVHGRIERERGEINEAIATVRADAEKRADKIEGKLDANTAMTSEMRGEVKQMNQNIHSLTTSVTQFLRDQAKPRRE